MEGNPTRADARRFGCPGCGGPLRYDIGKKKLVCESCDGLFSPSELPDPSLEEKDGRMDAVEYVCPSCGAAIHTSQTAAASFCSYCGSDVVLTERLSRITRPARIAPFIVTREECEKAYRQRLAQSHFAPQELLSQQTIDHFRPVYIPYWRYTFTAKGDGEGWGIKRYSDDKYNYEEEYNYDLRGDVKLTGLLYDASSAFEDDTARKLRFSAKESVPFHPAYLCGMYAEAADTSDVVFKNALEELAEEKYNVAAQSKTGVKGSFQLPHRRKTEAELVLMPVWLLASRQGERVLYAAVNGRTGEIVCDPPVSGKRFALRAAILFAAILTALLLVTQVVVLRPNLVLALCGILAAAAMVYIVPGIDAILLRRSRDVDPTRAMKRSSPRQDKPLSDFRWRLGEENALRIQRIFGWLLGASPDDSSLYDLIFFTFLVGGLALICFVGFLFSIGWSRSMELLISDHGVLAPAALIVSTILLFRVRYTYRDTYGDSDRKQPGVLDIALLMLMRALVLTGIVVVILHAPGVSLWCYGLSAAILALTAVCLARMDRLHNEFVTRPVPFFGKEERE